MYASPLLTSSCIRWLDGALPLDSSTTVNVFHSYFSPVEQQMSMTMVTRSLMTLS